MTSGGLKQQNGSVDVHNVLLGCRNPPDLVYKLYYQPGWERNPPPSFIFDDLYRQINKSKTPLCWRWTFYLSCCLCQSINLSAFHPEMNWRLFLPFYFSFHIMSSLHGLIDWSCSASLSSPVVVGLLSCQQHCPPGDGPSAWGRCVGFSSERRRPTGGAAFHPCPRPCHHSGDECAQVSPSCPSSKVMYKYDLVKKRNIHVWLKININI